MKARKDSLVGLTKEERLAKRKASMTAGDSWEDLHGTKDRPPKQFEREEQRLKYEALEAAREAGVDAVYPGYASYTAHQELARLRGAPAPQVSPPTTLCPRAVFPFS